MKRKNKFLIISAVIFVVIAIVCLILGLWFNGFDWGVFFKNLWWLFAIIGGLYGLLVLFVFSGDWIKKL